MNEVQVHHFGDSVALRVAGNLICISSEDAMRLAGALEKVALSKTKDWHNTTSFDFREVTE